MLAPRAPDVRYSCSSPSANSRIRSWISVGSHSRRLNVAACCRKTRFSLSSFVTWRAASLLHLAANLSTKICNSDSSKYFSNSSGERFCNDESPCGALAAVGSGRSSVRAACASLCGVGVASPGVDEGVSVVSGLGFEGTETVAKPRAGFDAGFFFFLLFGGIVGGGGVFCTSTSRVELAIVIYK